jgi:hypothetical protein
MVIKPDGWMSERMSEARNQVLAGPEWIRQAAASDYSARRQIHEGDSAQASMNSSGDPVHHERNVEKR